MEFIKYPAACQRNSGREVIGDSLYDVVDDEEMAWYICRRKTGSFMCAVVNKTMPNMTIGVPSNEHINSPVISGAQIIEAVKITIKIVCIFCIFKFRAKLDFIIKKTTHLCHFLQLAQTMTKIYPTPEVPLIQ